MTNIDEIKKFIHYNRIQRVSGIDEDLEFIIWDDSEIDDLNESYMVSNYHEGFYAIGTNGAGEMLIIELKTEMVYRIPFISIDN